jgi:hypothetical protein
VQCPGHALSCVRDQLPHVVLALAESMAPTNTHVSSRRFDAIPYRQHHAVLGRYRKGGHALELIDFGGLFSGNAIGLGR